MAEYIDRKASMTTPVLPKEYRQYQTDNLDDAYEQGLLDALDNLKNAPAVSVPQWISVKDRLPEPTEQWSHCIVLVNVAHWPTSTYDICDSPYDEEFVVTAMYNSKQKIWHINGWDEQINALLPIIDDEPVNGSCVTHWMPLPELPKGANDG